MLAQINTAFTIGTALLLLLPGPTNVLLMIAGTHQGWRKAWVLLLAEMVAYWVAITPLLIFNEALGTWRTTGGLVLKAIAIAIVLIMARRLWKSTADSTGQTTSLVSWRHVFWMTLFNPKSLIFAFAIFPPVIDATDIVFKGAIFCALVLAAGSAWVGIGQAMSDGRVIRSTLITKISAFVLCGFALYIASTMIADADAFFIRL